ncbi:MAG: hypothetical protein CVU56_23545 [Deltaproteobacteria bacterium HGW-Deltaproteobacteria-14]|nr:MAG: hypothetical protein CVU56_23545 [Deltaproteobacteria bacterium HGW-Deltaproteobacteria-14]
MTKTLWAATTMCLLQLGCGGTSSDPGGDASADAVDASADADADAVDAVADAVDASADAVDATADTSADAVDAVADAVDASATGCVTGAPPVAYRLADANQAACYDNKGDAVTCPATGAPFYGQDAQYAGLAPSYSVVCSDAVVLDDNTGLLWERAHHDQRASYAVAAAYCDGLELGGYDDWRMPSIKELFSISDWNGDQHEDGAFYLDSAAFAFDYPDLSDLTGTHSNQMMGQTWSSTSRPDVENLNHDVHYFFNFLDAHIKSQDAENANAALFYRCVRGDAAALDNELQDNGDGTVTDAATGLVWQRANGQQSAGDLQFSWKEALAYCEALALAGHDDWRLPDVRELQSIVDYDPPDWTGTHMALDTTVFAFDLPAGKDLTTPPTTSPPDGAAVAPFFWSSTTHGDNKSFAAYVCFGPCWAVEELGFGHDVHGPGAQRSDPKDDQMGNIWTKVGESIGDQQDVVQIDNFVRCVR